MQSALSRAAGPSLTTTVAAHDAQITLLAATDDGRVAVSADRRGSMRLWPSLDGRREPVMVDCEIAAERLAIGRDGEELVIAAAGALGQLALIRTTATGAPISTRRIDLERTLVALHATSSGFVGLRDDQTLAGVDLHGERLGLLRAAPGERIASITGRRGRLLALVTADGRVRGRWVEASEQLAWGSESAPLAIDPAHAVLAPDRERIAALAADGKTFAIVSLRDGRARGTPLTHDDVLFPVHPIGFLDDDTVALTSVRGDFGWWQRGEWKGMDLSDDGRPAVVTDRQLITGSIAREANLRLDTLERTKYLGFRLLNVRSMARHGGGWVITDGTTVLGIDQRLVARKRYRLESHEPERPVDVVLLDDRHLVAAIANQAYLFDLANPDDYVALTPFYGMIQYERTTQLVAIGSSEEGQWVGRYDPKAGAFRDTLEVHGPDWIELLDPAVNHGNVARRIVAQGSPATESTPAKPPTTATITPIRAIEFSADAPFREGRSYQARLPEPLAIRFAGRSLRGPPWPGETADGVAQLLPAVARHRTSPDGSLVATVAGGRIALRDRAGNARWAAALPGAIDVAWSGSGDLIAFGSGMARVDVATGALLDRRCGWEFGLWGSEEVVSDIGAKLCEAP